MKKRALISGCNGQDGYYLTGHLLSQGYEVFGLVRSSIPGSRIKCVEYLYGDLRDYQSILTAIQKSQPDEVYNLAGQVFVPTSWVEPTETFDVNTNGLLRILKALEDLGSDAKVYQASSSEIFGNAVGITCFQNPSGGLAEDTLMEPRSPYGCSKLAAHQLCEVYRQHGRFVCSGICFNHESPRRGMEMVTRKISRHVAAWKLGRPTMLLLGNMWARRDWGFAGDYVKAMHLMLQKEFPSDYVIGTGKSHSVKEFLETALQVANLPVEEYLQRVVTTESLIRNYEIKDLIANPSKAEESLGWKAETSFETLVEMMVSADYDNLKSSEV